MISIIVAFDHQPTESERKCLVCARRLDNDKEQERASERARKVNDVDVDERIVFAHTSRSQSFFSPSCLWEKDAQINDLILIYFNRFSFRTESLSIVSQSCIAFRFIWRRNLCLRVIYFIFYLGSRVNDDDDDDDEDAEEDSFFSIGSKWKPKMFVKIYAKQKKWRKRKPWISKLFDRARRARRGVDPFSSRIFLQSTCSCRFVLLLLLFFRFFVGDAIWGFSCFIELFDDIQPLVFVGLDESPAWT